MIKFIFYFVLVLQIESIFLSSNCDCKAGIINKAEFENRVIDGVETPPNKYPWLVGLVLGNENSTTECGGSLLSSRTVLTAAHCPNTGWVITGQHIKSIISGNERWYKVKSKTNHPLFNNRTIAYDLAIITLEQDVEFNEYARPICLPTDCTREYANDQVWVAGWGVESWPGNQSNVLREAKLTTMSNTECCTSPNKYRCCEITDDMICAADKSRRPCYGDSGGPIMINENGLYTVIGVVSWGWTCYEDGFPGVFSRVTSNLYWIMSNIEGKQCSCQL